MRRAERRTERGFAMIGVLLVMMLTMAIAGAIHTSTMGETQLRGAHAVATAGFYAAEAGINRGMGDYRNIFLSYNEPSGSDFDEKTLTLGNRTVRYQLTEACGGGGCPLTQVVAAGRPFAGLNSLLYKYVAVSTSELHEGDVETSLGTEFDVNYIPLFQFLAFFEGDLEINPGPTMTLNGPIHSNGSIYFNSNNTLNIADSPPSIPTVSVTARNNIYRGRKDSQVTPKCNGTVNLDKLADTNSDGSLDALAMACTGGSGSAVSQTDAMLASWLGALKARQPYVAVPQPDVLNRGTGTFWDQADLRLALDLTSPVTSSGNTYYPIVVLAQNDTTDATKTAILWNFMSLNPGRVFYNDVPTSDTIGTYGQSGTYSHYQSYAAPFSSQAQVYPCVQTALSLFTGCSTYMSNTTVSGTPIQRRGGFYNQREKAWVYMLNVNLHDLLVWNRAQPAGSRLFDPDDDTDGGLVMHLTVKGPLSNTAAASLPTNRRYGVRVFGSPNFDFPSGAADPTGVTVVSDQAIYVEGHYNVATGQTLYNAAKPWMPAALMGDTINVLSAQWSGNPTAGGWPVSGCRNDCQSRRTLSERPAATTYVNAAMLSGVDVTVVGSSTGYNGGFENYPRFHESWTGATLNYRGSFVSLGVPQHAKGIWCGTGGTATSGCNIYDAPTRAWNYDTNFQNVSLLPPLTPRVVSVEQILFTENFR